MKTYKYLVIVPARGGSKRLPGKNIIEFKGQPLIYHTLRAALDSQKLKDNSFIFVSTDSQKIAEVVKIIGIDIPFLRPKEIAESHSPVEEAVLHVLDNLEKQGVTSTNIILLPPTSPLRTVEHLDKAIEIFEQSSADTVVSVRELSDHPYWTWKIKSDKLVPFFSRIKMAATRSSIPPAFVENGAILITKTKIVIKNKILYGRKVMPFLMDEVSSIDIDTGEDLEKALDLSKKLVK